MLNEVSKVLETFEENVFYGMAQKVDGEMVWNYIVFNRDVMKKKASGQSYSDYVRVALVQEEYVRDGYAEEVIDAIEALPGFRLSEEDIEYDYVRKPNTDEVVEMCVIHFVRARKRD